MRLGPKGNERMIGDQDGAKSACLGMSGLSLDGMFDLITAKRDSAWRIVWMYHRWMSKVSEIKTRLTGHWAVNEYYGE